MNLYELNKEIENFEFDIDEETGEITNLAELDKLKMTMGEKCENIALYIKNLSADINAYDQEIKSFQDRKKSAKNKVESLKKYLAYSLNGKKFETDLVKVSFRKSSRVTIDNEEEFESYCHDKGLDSCLRRKVTWTPDKKIIKEKLKDNPDAFGGHAIIEETKTMSIK